jgi:hypothetical protein
MVSHRRAGIVARALRLRSSKAAVPGAAQAGYRAGRRAEQGKTPGITQRAAGWSGAGGLRDTLRSAAAGSELDRPGTWPVSGVRVMSGSQVEIEAVCEVHPGSGRLVISRKGDRIVLNSRADDCCVLTLQGPAVTLLFDVLGQWAGVSALARWVISPTDGRAHSLPVDGHPPGALRTRCGHWLSLCVVQRSPAGAAVVRALHGGSPAARARVRPRDPSWPPVEPRPTASGPDNQPVPDAAEVAVLDNGQHGQG